MRCFSASSLLPQASSLFFMLIISLPCFLNLDKKLLAQTSETEEAAEKPAAKEPEEEWQGNFYFDASGYGGNLNQSGFIGFTLGLLYKGETFSGALQAPLRFSIHRDKSGSYSALREEDWDEPSDFSRIVKFLLLRKKDRNSWLYAGELEGVAIGHGTIVSNFYSTADRDHYKSGLQAKYLSRLFGFDALVNDYFSPSVFAFRGFIHPFAFFKSEGVMNRFSLGMTVAADIFAPYNMITNSAGKNELNSVNLMVHNSDSISVIGLETEMMIYQGKKVELTPYADINFLGTTGAGLHAGIALKLKLWIEKELFVRGEYRLMHRDYMPGYFGAAYMVERYQYKKKLSKSRYAGTFHNSGSIHGYMLESGFSMRNRLTILVHIEDSQGIEQSCAYIKASLDSIPQSHLSFMYSKQGMSDLAGAFDPDGSFILTEYKLHFGTILYIFASYGLEWYVVRDGDEIGNYDQAHNFMLGLGYDASL
jgi:hypothetical protein